MSCTYNANDFHYRSSDVPNVNTFTICMWVRRNTDLAARGIIGAALGQTSSSGNNTYSCREETSDDMRLYNGATQLNSASDNMTNDTWRFLVLSRNTNDTGTLRMRWLDGAETTLGAVATTGLTALAPTGISINTARSDGTAFEAAGEYTVLAVKCWSGVDLGDADLLTERLYKNVQTNLGSLWAHYRMDNGALTTDSSGNGRDLTASGSPTYSADEPAAILGDDPAAGGGGGGGLGLIGPGGLIGPKRSLVS